MSTAHTIHESTPVTRDASVNQALALGFTKVDLWNLDSAIVRTVQSILETAAVTGVGSDTPAEIVELLTVINLSDSAVMTPELAQGIDLIPSIVRSTKDDNLTRLGQLIQVFADYTRTTPSDIDMLSWRVGLALAGAAIEQEVPLLRADAEHSEDVLREAFSFIVKHFEQLWD
jgi:hypothetical protein